jgi:Protein of unknown function (Hypoth_ymh)
MNIDWMRQKLEHFLALCEEYERAWDIVGDYDKTTMRPIEDAISDALPTVEHIIRQLDPRLLTDGFGQAALHGGMLESTRQTRRALAVLRDREDWKINLAPDSPSLPANEFHPSIWSAAAPVWDTGEYKLAAQSACVSLSAHIKDKAGSPPLHELALVAQVFSMEGAQPGQCRLHFPGAHSDENWKSRQQGLHFLAQGAFAGIANIAAHDHAAWTEHEALEHLAVLSVVARWADETHLVSV